MSSLGSALVLGSGRVSGARRAGWVLRAAAVAAVTVAVVVVGSSSVRASSHISNCAAANCPKFLAADAAPEAATVALLAVGDDQVLVGPPVRAHDTDTSGLRYRLSDTDAGSGHSDLFSVKANSGQISRWTDTPPGVYKVTVSVSDDGDFTDSDNSSVDVVIHVTSAGLYPRWSQAASVTAGDGTSNDWFGASVDVSGGVFAVGAPFADSSTVTGSGDGAGPGAAYLFDASSGAQLARLDSPNAANGGWFGFQVQVVGDLIFVSAPREAIGTVSDAGRVYVFEKPAGGWADTSTVAATLTPSATSVPNDANNGLGGARFGYGLAVSDDGSTLAAGAPYWQRLGDTGQEVDVTGMDRDGAVFVFAKPATGWADADTDDTGVVRLFGGSRLDRYSRLGERVAVSDDGAVIAAAAPFGDDSEGEVFMFTKPSSGWASTAIGDTPVRLQAMGRFRQQRMGSKGLDISGDGSTVAVGTPVGWRKGQADDAQITSADAKGAAHVFVRPATGWADATETAKLATFGHKYDGFGSGIAISDSGDKIAVSNPFSRSSNFRGSVHVYTKPAEGWGADNVSDGMRVLTAAVTGVDATDTRQRYGFGARGLVFAGEDELVVGQLSQVWALHRKDGLSSLPTGGLYGANADHSDRANVAQGSAYVFNLAPAPPQFIDADRPLAAATVTLLAAGENQTLVGPPVRAFYHGDRGNLVYSLSDNGNGHSGLFTVNSDTGQISRRSGTRAVGVFEVKVNVTDGTGSDTADVTVHVTSPGRYPGQNAWVQDFSVKAGDEDPSNQFGHSIDVDDEVIVVGAVHADTAVPNSGAVYVYDADSGAQLARLTSPTPKGTNTFHGLFGTSVAVADDTIAVGAHLEDPPAGQYVGKAYLFTKPPGGWEDTNSPKATLVPDSSHAGGFAAFGTSLALSDDGNTLVVGLHNDGGGGSVAVFTKPAGDWVDASTGDAEVVRLTAGDRAQNGHNLGHFVAISGDGNTIAANATGAVNGNGMGVVYVFDKPDDGDWTSTDPSDVVARLSVQDMFTGQRFGGRSGNRGERSLSLSYDGSTLVVSSTTDWKRDSDGDEPDDAYGSAFVYVRPGTDWADATETAELRSFGHKYDNFSHGVAISPSGNTIAVGNPWSRSSNYRGSVYVYTKPAGGWVDDLDGRGDNVRVLTAADADTDPRHRYAFGTTMAFNGEDQLAVGQQTLVWEFGEFSEFDQNDGLAGMLAGGRYGANAGYVAGVTSGSAYRFNLRTAPQIQQPVAPPPPPPPPPPDDGDDGTDPPDGPDDGTDVPDEPEGPAPPPEFADVDEGSVHAQSIEKVAALGITSGTTPTTFSPSDTVTRAQMATFVARTWEAAGRDCPSTGASSFADVASGSTHAAGIDCAAALGVTAGTADRTFSPSEPVTRAQMATFLARAWQAAGRECSDVAASAFFDDVPADSTHAAGIACMASLRIARGTASGAFSPSDTVTRAQMATFLARFHQALTN